ERHHGEWRVRKARREQRLQLDEPLDAQRERAKSRFVVEPGGGCAGGVRFHRCTVAWGRGARRRMLDCIGFACADAVLAVFRRSRRCTAPRAVSAPSFAVSVASPPVAPGRMLQNYLTRIFGSRNERLLKSYRKTVAQINALEPQIQALDDAQLAAKTVEFRQRVEAGESLDALLPEAFAVCREAAVRTLGMRHFDVQLIGGMVLHAGKIAEMRTGEGKTLT